MLVKYREFKSTRSNNVVDLVAVEAGGGKPVIWLMNAHSFTFVIFRAYFHPNTALTSVSGDDVMKQCQSGRGVSHQYSPAFCAYAATAWVVAFPIL